MSPQAPAASRAAKPSRASTSIEAVDLDLVGIGSMVVDRVHRAARILGPDEKGPLQSEPGGASVRTFIGGVILNQLGWASALGLRTGIFGKGADDENGRNAQGGDLAFTTTACPSPEAKPIPATSLWSLLAMSGLLAGAAAWVRSVRNR